MDTTMDPATIAAALGALLVPFLKKVGEDFAGEAGRYVQGRAKALWASLRSRLEGDPKAKEALDHFEANPDGGKEEFEAVVGSRVAEDPSLRDELAAALAEIKRQAPQLTVVQRMKDAEEMTGIRARRMNRGTAEVTQEADRVTHATGIDLDEIG
jgi:hypothetical protein